MAAIPNRYRLYIDESGDHTYNLLDQVSHRYLALMGVWFRQADDYVHFADRLEAFKREIFGPRPDRPIVLHRSEIINRKGAFGLLCDPEVRRRFDDGLLGVIARARFKMIIVIIDKRQHLRTYQQPYHPYHFCLAAMLDRYSGWLRYKACLGDVMAESRGGQADRELKQAYREVYEEGRYSMFSADFHQQVLTSRDIKVKPKMANIAGLQLADILAYPVKQAWLAERRLIETASGQFGQRVMEVVTGKYNVNEGTGQVAGYGKVWLPRSR
ncbi:MAG TPA: DUF3800 domain-containing protein [Phycisphaerae bacterium]|nr:DUF3800 domain-containing protein [Phycisphaerae bacterium]